MSGLLEEDHRAGVRIQPGGRGAPERTLPEHTQALARYVAGRTDRTDQYLDELDRVERINRYHTGYRYPTWRRVQSWTWADAPRYLTPGAADPTAPNIRNSSPTGWWRWADGSTSGLLAPRL